MNRFYFIILFLVSFIPNSFSQKTLDDYSHVIVSEQFSFQKEKNKYELNSLTKFLFNKYGFHAYFNSEVPSNVKRCDGLWADAERSPGFIYTKIVIVLTDCNGNEVFRSPVGSSKVKDYKKAYYESMRKAFKSIESLHINQKEIDDESLLISEDSKPLANKENTKIIKSDSIQESNTEIISIEVFDKEEVAKEKIDEVEEMKLEPSLEKSNAATKIESPELVAEAVVVESISNNDKGEVIDNKESAIVVPQTTAIENLPSAKYSTYTYNNSIFLLRKTSNGYSLYKENEALDDDLLLIGKIEITDTIVSFIDPESNKFAAYFDTSKNLFVLKDSNTIIYNFVD